MPSAESSAWVARPAGSEPTFDSVSAKAEMAPLASRGRYFLFCSGVPKSLSGVGTPIDWAAERRAVRLPVLAGDQANRLGVHELDKPEPAILSRNLDSEGAQLTEPLYDIRWNLRFAVNPVAIDLFPHEAL